MLFTFPNSSSLPLWWTAVSVKQWHPFILLHNVFHILEYEGGVNPTQHSWQERRARQVNIRLCCEWQWRLFPYCHPTRRLSFQCLLYLHVTMVTFLKIPLLITPAMHSSENKWTFRGCAGQISKQENNEEGSIQKNCQKLCSRYVLVAPTLLSPL